MPQTKADRAEYRKAYYAANREREIARSKEYNRTHPEKIATYRRANKDRISEYHANRRSALSEKFNYDNREYYARLKAEVFTAYGGQRCACCGETLFEGLTLDHIHGDGAGRRRAGEPAGVELYRALKKKGYPLGYQVLCATCNMAKGINDHCPHEDYHIAWG